MSWQDNNTVGNGHEKPDGPVMVLSAMKMHFLDVSSIVEETT